MSVVAGAFVTFTMCLGAVGGAGTIGGLHAGGGDRGSGVCGRGSGVWGMGPGAWDLGSRAWDLGSGIWDLGPRVWSTGNGNGHQRQLATEPQVQFATKRLFFPKDIKI